MYKQKAFIVTTVPSNIEHGHRIFNFMSHIQANSEPTTTLSNLLILLHEVHVNSRAV